MDVCKRLRAEVFEKYLKDYLSVNKASAIVIIEKDAKKLFGENKNEGKDGGEGEFAEKKEENENIVDDFWEEFGFTFDENSSCGSASDVLGITSDMKEKRIGEDRCLRKEDGSNDGVLGEQEKGGEEKLEQEFGGNGVKLKSTHGRVEVNVERQNVYYSVTDGDENINEENDHYVQKSISMIGQHYENCRRSENDVYENVE
jgi:hypothetical protein